MLLLCREEQIKTFSQVMRSSVDAYKKQFAFPPDPPWPRPQLGHVRKRWFLSSLWLESRHLRTKWGATDVYLYRFPSLCTHSSEPRSLEGKKKKRGDLIERDLFIKKPWIQLHSFNLRNVVMAFQHGNIFRWEYVININSRKETIKLTQFETEQTQVFD